MPLVSTVTGRLLTAAACDPAYWWRNLRAPVRSRGAVAAAAALGPCLFLEIGPTAALQGYLRNSCATPARMPRCSPACRAATRWPTLSPPRRPRLGRRRRSARRPRLRRPGGASRPAALPRRPPALWYPATVEALTGVAPPEEHPLLGFRGQGPGQGPEPALWSRLIDTTLDPWLADHRLAGEAVLPAAAMWEMALAAGLARHPEAVAIELREAMILAALPLEQGHARELRSTLDPAGRFTLESRRRLAPEPWTLHLEAMVAAPAGLARRTAGGTVAGGTAGWRRDPRPSPRPPDCITARPWKSLQDAQVDAVAGLAAIRLCRPDAAPGDAGFLLHPARLDGALQGLVGLLAAEPAPPGTGIVPVRLARLVARVGALPAAQADLSLSHRGERSAIAGLVLRDAAGLPVAVLEGCTLQRIRLPGRVDPAEGAFRIALQPAAPLPGQDAGTRPDLAPCLEAARREDAARDLGDAGMLLEGFCAATAHAALSAAPAAGPQARGLLEELAKGGLAVAGPGGLRPLPGADLPPAREIWCQVLLEQPDLAPDLAWAALAAERLPAVLADWHAAPDAALVAGPPPGSAGERGSAWSWPSGRRLRRRLAARPAAAGAASRGRRRVADRAPGGGAAGLGPAIRFTAAALPGRPAAAGAGGAAGWTTPRRAGTRCGAAPPLAADLIIGLGLGARLRAGALLPEALRRAPPPVRGAAGRAPARPALRPVLRPGSRLVGPRRCRCAEAWTASLGRRRLGRGPGDAAGGGALAGGAARRPGAAGAAVLAAPRLRRSPSSPIPPRPLRSGWPRRCSRAAPRSWCTTWRRRRGCRRGVAEHRGGRPGRRRRGLAGTLAALAASRRRRKAPRAASAW